MNKQFALVLTIPLTLTACPREQGLTGEEAREALQQAALSSQVEGFTASAVDIATHFTIGRGVEEAADELRTFVSSQMPCAAVTLEPGSLTVEYGAKPGHCAYRGHTYSGKHAISVTRNEMSEVVVNHNWMELSNGNITVNGSAVVTWNFQNQSRHVTHNASFVDASRGLSGEGTGDRLQTVLSGGLAEGIREDGSRSWTGARGTWDLAIDGVEMRWVDPVPQAGSYTLRTPNDKSLSMDFTRLDSARIQVRVSSGGSSFKFNVTALGLIEQAK